MKYKIQPTGNERFFSEDEIIVTKTDTKGIITYVNEVFINISGYKEEDLIGQPQSIIRHPMMPRCIFKLLWDKITAKEEIFAYVNNLAKNGDNYWVFAHVTPSFGTSGEVIGYHSSRRSPRREAVEAISDIYASLLDVEKNQSDKKGGLHASFTAMNNLLNEKGLSYEEFVFSL